MSFFNLPDIFHFPQNVIQGYESRHERDTAYDMRNSTIIEPLETRLSKLEDIRDRIGTRIDKEVASGTDMTNASAILGSADQTLEYAAQAVAVATSTIDGANSHPAYQLIQAAYFNLTQAKDALSAVLDAIQAAGQASSTASENN